jgi:uncharacterized RDD family membrane protein YckC
LLDGSERGATLGKRALKIQVRDATAGGPVGVGKALLRRFVFVILWLPFIIPGLINVLSPLWDKKRQSWHDKATNSVVIVGDAGRL